MNKCEAAGRVTTINTLYSKLLAALAASPLKWQLMDCDTADSITAIAAPRGSCAGESYGSILCAIAWVLYVISHIKKDVHLCKLNTLLLTRFERGKKSYYTIPL